MDGTVISLGAMEQTAISRMIYGFCIVAFLGKNTCDKFPPHGCNAFR